MDRCVSENMCMHAHTCVCMYPSFLKHGIFECGLIMLLCKCRHEVNTLYVCMYVFWIRRVQRIYVRAADGQRIA